MSLFTAKVISQRKMGRPYGIGSADAYEIVCRAKTHLDEGVDLSAYVSCVIAKT